MSHLKKNHCNRIRELGKFYYAIQETVHENEIINGYHNPFTSNSFKIHYEDMIKYEQQIDSHNDTSYGSLWKLKIYTYHITNATLVDQIYNLPYPKVLIAEATIKFSDSIEKINAFCECVMRRYKKLKLLNNNSLKSICMKIVLNNKMDLKYAHDLQYYYGLRK